LKNKQRHLSVAGKVGAVCAVVWLFLFCVWDFLSFGNDISLCTKHAPFLMLYCWTVNTEPECFCNIVWSITDKVNSTRHTSLSCSMPYRVLLAGCPVDLKQYIICSSSSSLCLSNLILSEINWEWKSFMLLVGNWWEIPVKFLLLYPLK
jgi:hypothetical protein